MEAFDKAQAQMVEQLKKGTEILINLSQETVKAILEMNVRAVTWDDKTTLPPPGPLPPPPPGFFKPLVGRRSIFLLVDDPSPQESDEPIIVERNSDEKRS